MKVYLRVDLPDELLGEFMQAIRDFDVKHDPNHEGRVHFESLAESDWPLEKMAKIFKAITPQPAFFYTVKLDKDTQA